MNKMHREHHIDWVNTLANEIGIYIKSNELLESAETILNSYGQEAYKLYDFLEFSFPLSKFPSPKKLRYTIDITQFKSDDVKKLINKGISLLKGTTEEVKYNKIYHSLYDITKNFAGYNSAGHPVYRIGLEYTANNTAPIFKTYWRFLSPFKELNSLLSENRKITFKKVLETVKTIWPEWNNARLVGIDYLPDGNSRFKLYFPSKDFEKPLLIADLKAFILNTGWKLDPDIFQKISFFLLCNQNEALPTSYSVGFTIGEKPSIKIEIATSAYFKSSEQSLLAGRGLAQSLGLDASLILSDIEALSKNCPTAVFPFVEVICVNFYPDGDNSVTLYSTLYSK